MRQLCCAFLILILAVSCRDKVICPTFQSTFILDDSVRTTYFSYLWYLDEDERRQHLETHAQVAPKDTLNTLVASADDSATPVDYFAYTADYKAPLQRTSKTKFGIIKRPIVLSTLIRNIQMKTGPRQNVLTPPQPEAMEEDVPSVDSTAVAADSLQTLPSRSDSLQTDSTSVVAAAKADSTQKEEDWERFRYEFEPRPGMHPDQDFYYKKYGWLLQNARPEPDTTQATQPDSLMADSTAKKGFLGGLFKPKKNKGEKKGFLGGIFGKKKQKGEPKEEEETPEVENNNEAPDPEEKQE